MSEKELRHHQKANRGAAEQHRTTKSQRKLLQWKKFKTPQSLRKENNSIKKSLPKSSHHKKELLSLANDFSIECFVIQETANCN